MRFQRDWAKCFLVFALLASCGSSGDTPPDNSNKGGQGGSSGDNCGPSGDMSFSKDVAPIFAASCAFGTTCHGDATHSEANLFLGPKPVDESKLGAVHKNLVGVKSSVTSMVRVKASDPSASFLMHKLDHDQGSGDLSCTGQFSEGPCGEGMPKSGEKLPCDELATIRLWIAQGAKNN